MLHKQTNKQTNILDASNHHSHRTHVLNVIFIIFNGVAEPCLSESAPSQGVSKTLGLIQIQLYLVPNSQEEQKKIDDLFHSSLAN